MMDGLKLDGWHLNALQSMQCIVLNSLLNFCKYCLDPHCGGKCAKACGQRFNNIVFLEPEPFIQEEET
jgi:hypothetical protein